MAEFANGAACATAGAAEGCAFFGFPMGVGFGCVVHLANAIAVGAVLFGWHAQVGVVEVKGFENVLANNLGKWTLFAAAGDFG